MEEKELIRTLVEVCDDPTANVYAFIVGRITAISKSDMFTAEEKVKEIQTSIQCLDKALEEIYGRLNNE